MINHSDTSITKCLVSFIHLSRFVCVFFSHMEINLIWFDKQTLMDIISDYYHHKITNTKFNMLFCLLNIHITYMIVLTFLHWARLYISIRQVGKLISLRSFSNHSDTLGTSYNYTNNRENYIQISA